MTGYYSTVSQIYYLNGAISWEVGHSRAWLRVRASPIILILSHAWLLLPCRVHGVSGLRVAHASVAPRIPSTPTQAMAVMIGDRVASVALNDRGAKQ